MTETRDELKPEAGLYSARKLVIEAMPKIIEMFIVQAKGGSCLHAKFLVEFADGGQGNPSIDGSEESLAAMLMKELRQSSEP